MQLPGPLRRIGERGDAAPGRDDALGENLPAEDPAVRLSLAHPLVELAGRLVGELGAALGLDVHPGRPEVAQVEDVEEDIQGRGDRVAHSLDDSPRRRIP